MLSVLLSERWVTFSGFASAWFPKLCVTSTANAVKIHLPWRTMRLQEEIKWSCALHSCFNWRKCFQSIVPKVLALSLGFGSQCPSFHGELLQQCSLSPRCSWIRDNSACVVMVRVPGVWLLCCSASPWAEILLCVYWAALLLGACSDLIVWGHVCSLVCCQLCVLLNTVPMGVVGSTSDTLIRVPGEMALTLGCPHLPTVAIFELINHTSLLRNNYF